MKEKRWLGTQKYEIHCFYCGGFHITGNCPQVVKTMNGWKYDRSCPETGHIKIVPNGDEYPTVLAFNGYHYRVVGLWVLKVAQKLMLWMEECMAACDFNQDDMDLYHELRQTIRTAGGFSSDTHWWQGPCICSACSHTWQGVVEIPVEATSPQVPLECSECHQMTGGPA